MSAADARLRHPSTRSPVPAPRLQARVAGLLDQSGVRWPHIAAATLRVRGRTGHSPDELARRIGIAPDVIRRAEAGEMAIDELPPALRGPVADVLRDAAASWPP
jgi:hypothetical protein